MTQTLVGLLHGLRISIHTSLAGSDSIMASVMVGRSAFQSTLPLREVTVSRVTFGDRVVISIHTSLAGSDPIDTHAQDLISISIHTSLAGSDPVVCPLFCASGLFQSTLPLREVTVAESHKAPLGVFQSTLPLREVTVSARSSCLWPGNFNPHFPCGK